MKNVLLLLFFVNIAFANIGSISSVIGKASIERDKKRLEVVLGLKIEKKDIIKTEANSKVKIRLIDNTLITLGKNSALNIEEYLYDTKVPANSKTNLNFFKGAFKTITGNIGKINPSKFKLKTKSASIGIRGTKIIGNEKQIACTEGEIEVMIFGKKFILKEGEIIDVKKDVKGPRKYTKEEIENLNPIIEPTTFGDILSDNPIIQEIQDLKNQDSIQEEIQNIQKEIQDDIQNAGSEEDTVSMSGYLVGKDYVSGDGVEIEDSVSNNLSVIIDRDAKSISGGANFIYRNPGGNIVESASSSLSLQDPSTYNSDDFFSTSLSVTGATTTSSLFTTISDTSIDNESSWGYWSVSYTDKFNDNHEVVDSSAWVAGVETDVSIITNYLDGETAYLSFSGQMIGSVYDGESISSIELDENNFINLNLDFGSGTDVIGDFKFTTSDSTWQGDINSGTISATGFSSTSITDTNTESPFVDLQSNPSYLEGKFYGTGEIKSVGGKFNFNTEDETASGVFKADLVEAN